MTLRIDLADEQTAALEAKAQALGLTAEQYARQVLEHDLNTGSQPRRRISEAIRKIWSDMPDDGRASLPRDGASQVDRYVCGPPKRDQ